MLTKNISREDDHRNGLKNKLRLSNIHLENLKYVYYYSLSQLLSK